MSYYDHRDKVGNEGDVVKHSLLAAVAENLMESKQNANFIYAETHTGRPRYNNLPEDGRWVNGVGPFSAQISELTTNNLPEDNGENYNHLLPYWENCFRGPVEAGSSYYGSNGIVFEMLRKAGKSIEFHLWDNSAAVCHSLLSYYEAWPQVNICRGDGYRGIRTLDKADLVLVDPVSIKSEEEQLKIMETLSILSDQKIPFICWTAIVGGDEREADKFKERVRKRFAVYWVTWTPQQGATRGCQITVPQGELAQLAGATLSQIVSLMDDWEVGQISSDI